MENYERIQTISRTGQALVVDRLKTLMKSKSLRASTLAKVIGVNENTVYGILEQGKQPRIVVLMRISLALDCHPSYLLGLSPHQRWQKYDKQNNSKDNDEAKTALTEEIMELTYVKLELCSVIDSLMIACLKGDLSLCNEAIGRYKKLNLEQKGI